MVMARNQLMNEFDFAGNTAFRTLSHAITGVHETVIETRMQTTGSLFERYRRIVRDLARQLGKKSLSISKVVTWSWTVRFSRVSRIP